MSTEFESREMKESISETVVGERIFEVEGKKLRLRFPNNRESQLADLEYSKEFTNLLDTNLKTRGEMEEMLEKRKIWSVSDETKIETIQKTISDVYEKLAKAKSEKERQKCLTDLAKHRKEIQKIQSKKEVYLANTIESKAENIKLGYLIHCVTTYLDSGEQVWKKYSDFVNEENQVLLSTTTWEFLTFSNGIPSSFLEQSPQDTDPQEENGVLDGE